MRIMTLLIRASEKRNERIILTTMKINRIIAAFAACICAVSAFSCTKKNDESSKKQEAATTAAQTEAAAETTTEVTVTENETQEADDDGKDISDYVTVKETTPAMYKVTDPETGNELYMLGTMHMVLEDTFPMPSYIMDVYNNCDGIAVELDINSIMSDMQQLQDFYGKLVYTDGTTVKDHLSEETYEKMKEYLTKYNAYNPMLESYVAGFWANQVESISILSTGDLDTEGVDSKFISMANEDGKKVVNIETVDIQSQLFLGGSDELFDYKIADILNKTEDSEAYTKEFAEFYDNWASGDIDKLDEEDDEDDVPEDLKDDYEEYMDAILYDRNDGMAAKAEEFLKNGDNYFFMVGAAHFAGDKGVDDILKEKGYTVERVAA